ncbi:MAG: tRNA (adenosine(37)-N6)-dimethylallyltransferase MiaA [Muribaculaceae bacterium]|nr:tRNA (adenosine(37)-N6)-dimethylallyltransferase MiaA [Muribaculaceae bacterium]
MNLIVITGPTASGKSALALEIAQMVGGEIISADSRQVFRDLPVATAQPDPQQLALVPHHFVGNLPLDSYFSASEFEQQALALIADMMERGVQPVVCGGSMMYVDALCNGLDRLPTVSDSLRDSLCLKWQQCGDEWLLDELRRLDPDYYETVDRCNLKRVFHAVEISMQAGAPYSSLIGQEKPARPFPIRKYAIRMDREQLFARINARVEAMVESGLVEEVKAVAGYRALNSMNTVGVKEILAYLDGTMDLPRAVARLQKNTRVYAKKQLTWLKRDPDIFWGTHEEIIADIKRLL